MNESSGDTQREAAALAETLVAQNEAPQQQREDVVPVHVVQSIREELKSLKSENETYKNHINMMQWQNQQKPAQPAPNPFGNLDPADSITVKDAMGAYQGLEQRFNAQLAEVKMAQRTPDYGDVVKRYLPLAAQEDPELIQEIQNSANPFKAAYMAAKASRAYQEDLIKDRMKVQESAPKPHPHAERVINNAKQSGSLASVSSNITPSGSHAGFKNMSDSEFLAWKNENVGRGKARTI